MQRRHFLKGLSLGAGSLALSPIVSSLVHAADGTVPKVRRLVVLINSNGMNFDRFTPLLADENLKKQGGFVETRDFELPPMYEALAPFRDRLLLLDGLPNRNGAGHYGQYVALSCVPNAGHGPRAETFDQYVARHIGGTTPFRSLTLGTHKQKGTRSYTGTCAFGPGQPVPIITSPSVAYEKVFGLFGEESSKQFSARFRVLDRLAEDAKRVKARLAPTEQVKFDQYLQSLEITEARLQAIQSFQLPSGCGGSVMADADLIEQRAAQMFELGKQALSCGLTNVLTICNGSAQANWDFPEGVLGMPGGFHTMGHGGGGGPATYDTWLNYNAGLLADLMQHLQQFPEGDGTMLDNTLILWTNDNGEQHHARYFRWPYVLIGNAGGLLKADGRYIRYPVRTQKEPTEHSLAEMYNTLSHAFGAPTDSFGKGGSEPVNGPLAELMA